jgi:pimeloyl-ACP methyl ester carboxylesterase
MGGHVLLEALNELKGVKGIFINGSPPFGLPPAPDIFLPHPALPLFFKGQHTEQELDMLSKAMLYNEELFEAVKTELKKSDPVFRDVWMPNIQAHLPKDELEVVKNTTVPMAVVHGENDNLANLDYIKKVPFNKLWDNRVHTIPEAGHLPFFKQAEVYNVLLSDFCYEQFHQDED